MLTLYHNPTCILKLSCSYQIQETEKKVQTAQYMYNLPIQEMSVFAKRCNILLVIYAGHKYHVC